MRLPLVIAIAALGLTTTGLAASQSKAAAAEALFEEGRNALDSKDYATACARFRESQRLDPAVGTLLNLARCEEERGKLATAWELYRRALSDLPDSDDRAPIAKKRADALTGRLPKLTVRFRGTPPKSAVVRVGDVELLPGSLDTPLPVDPGKFQLEVRAPGHANRLYALELTEAEKKEIEVEAGKTETENPVGPSEKRSSSGSTIGWIVGGAGVAGLAVGGIAGALALGKKSDVDANCDAAKLCTPAGTEAADQGKTYARVSTVGWIAGALGVGLGAYLILSSSPSSGSRTTLGATPHVGGAQLGLLHSW